MTLTQAERARLMALRDKFEACSARTHGMDYLQNRFNEYDDACVRAVNEALDAPEPTADLTALKCAVADAYRAKEEAWESSISHDPEIDDHLRNTWLALDAAYAALVAAQEGGLTNGE